MKNLTKFTAILQKVLVPPRLVHWKTPVLISVFFFFLSALETKNQGLKNTIADCSWLFLTIAIGWRTSQEPFIVGGISLSPWVTGALICVFLWENLTPDSQSLAIVFWPLISICLAVIIEFIRSGAKFQSSPPLVRPIFLGVILSHALISCLLAFHFIIQGWLAEYPTLLVEDFSKSGFVVSFKQESLMNSRGVAIVKLMEEQIRSKTRTKSWEEVAYWLIAVDTEKIFMRNEVLKKLSPLAENSKWEIETPIIQGQSLYKIQLLARWLGPTTQEGGYTLGKYCEVAKAGNRGSVKCNPVKIYTSKVKRDQFQRGIQV